MSSTPQSSSNKKRFLSSPADLMDSKKVKQVTVDGIAEEQPSSDSPDQPIMTFSLTEDVIAQITDSLKASFDSHISIMVGSIIDGVLGGLNKQVSYLQTENAQLKERVKDLESKMDSAEQYSRRNCLRLSGIPEIKGESVDDKIMEISAAIGADISIEEVDRAHRVGRPRTNEGPQAKPRDIIVKFISYRSRQKFMRRKSSLKSKGFSRVYINEDLTRSRNGVFFQARKLARESRVNSAWVADGVILVKDKTLKVHRVESQSDLDDLIQAL